MQKKLTVTLNKSPADCSSFYDVAREVSEGAGDRYEYTCPMPKPTEKALERAALRGTGEDVSLDRQKDITVGVSIKEAVTKFSESEDVVAVEEDIEPTPLLSKDWPVEGVCKGGMNCMDGWNMTGSRGEGMVVAVLEWFRTYGFRYTHKGLGGSGHRRIDWAKICYGTHPCFVPFRNTYGELIDPYVGSQTHLSGFGHGTMTASCIISQGGTYPPGSAPRAKVMAALGYFPKNIVLAVDQGADVISVSYTNSGISRYFPAIDYAISQGVPVVWAHSCNEDVFSDKGYHRSVLVSSHDVYGRSCYSYGNVTVSAPGRSVKVASPYYDTRTKYTGGESLSTPFVAGVIALALKQNPTWKVSDVRDALAVSSVRNVDDRKYPMEKNSWTERYGWGMVNARNLLSLRKNGDVFEWGV